MMKKQHNSYRTTFLSFLTGLAVLLSAGELFAQQHGGISRDSHQKKIFITDASGNLSLAIDYAQGAKISELKIKGRNVLSDSGVYTGFRTRGGSFVSCHAPSDIQATIAGDAIELTGIAFGDLATRVKEVWRFRDLGDRIAWTIEREYSSLAKLEETYFPQWNFANLSVWKGGILDNGGMVWCKYLGGANDTFGVHTGGVTFWNPDSGDALRITTRQQDGKYIAAKYSRSSRNEFTCTQSVTDTELEPRYNLNRFAGGHADIFAPFDVQKGGKVTLEMEIAYLDYDREYSRGKLTGIDEKAVRELMNTTGRYGVVDNGIVGANGWTTNWKCLHEPFFAQIGMALNDENYVKNMSETLDRERDHAIMEDGRVMSRWHNADDDQMPGTFNYKTGYYEARWGITVDSQTGHIINVADQFDLCGDVEWLRSHKEGCEKALGWLIARDTNGNGIYEMMNDSCREQTCSDWLDIVWASFENAFVNAQMYGALTMWANCENILGDGQKARYYAGLAAKMKENFNKTIDEGGFWSPEKKQYVYWREKDGKVCGDNFVTPVNFAVIGFGLCDDKERTAIILDEIERRSVAENLFHWPLCFDSFRPEEVSPSQAHFPTYENGDIFPTWGYLGVRSYVQHDKNIALKYIRNILRQYNKDGLSSQRYARQSQTGVGSDILAGICTSVTALYRDIYGIRPAWNRMGFEPNMPEELNDTEFSYTLRGRKYDIRLRENEYVVHSEGSTVKSNGAFGIGDRETGLLIYPHNKEEMTLAVRPQAKSETGIALEIGGWDSNGYNWTVASPGNYRFEVTGLRPGTNYLVSVDGKPKKMKTGSDGIIGFSRKCNGRTDFRIEE